MASNPVRRRNVFLWFLSKNAQGYNEKSFIRLSHNVIYLGLFFKPDSLLALCGFLTTKKDTRMIYWE